MSGLFCACDLCAPSTLLTKVSANFDDDLTEQTVAQMLLY